MKKMLLLGLVTAIGLAACNVRAEAPSEAELTTSVTTYFGNLFQRFGVMQDYFADKQKISPADLGRFNVTGPYASGFNSEIALLDSGDQFERHIRNISLGKNPDRDRHVLVVDDLHPQARACGCSVKDGRQRIIPTVPVVDSDFRLKDDAISFVAQRGVA